MRLIWDVTLIYLKNNRLEKCLPTIEINWNKPPARSITISNPKPTRITIELIASDGILSLKCIDITSLKNRDLVDVFVSYPSPR